MRSASRTRPGSPSSVAWRPVEGATRRRVLVALGAALVAGTLASCASSDDAARAEPTTTERSSATAATSTPQATTTSTSSTTTAPPTTTTTLPPTPGPDSLSIAMAGDLLTHLPLVAQAGAYGRDAGVRYDFGPMLAPMAPIVGGADLAICHLEVPLARDQAAISGYPSFGAPDELVDAIAGAGYDGCSTASNHSLDQGADGIARTLGRFDELGLHHAGTARSAEEGAAITTYDVGGASVAHLSYAYGFNGYRLPAGQPFAANQIDVARIRDDARRAREAGAQLVIVSLHWGDEYQPQPSAFQRQVAADLLPSDDIDVLVGHHAHVVQPIEQVEGTYVVWGLGNQLANQRQVPRTDGLTVVLHAAKEPGGRYRVAGIEAVPTYVEGGTFKVLPVVPTVAAGASGALRDELLASYDRTAAVLATAPTPGVTLAARPG